MPEQYTAMKKEIWLLTSYWSSQEQISRANPPIFICKWSFQMSVTGEVNGRERDVTQETCLGTLFERENKFWEWAHLPRWAMNIREHSNTVFFHFAAKGLQEKQFLPQNFERFMYFILPRSVCVVSWFSNFCHCTYLVYLFTLTLRCCSYVLVMEKIPCVWVNFENTFGELYIVNLVAMNL